MPKRIGTENPGADVRRYLRHWADEQFVEGMLRARHPSISAEVARRRRRQIAFSIDQGLEYLASAEAASLLTGPLPLFYAAENFAKALCMDANPAFPSSDFQDHGLTRDRAKRNSIKNLRCSVKARTPNVWSRFFQVANADSVVLSRNEDGQGMESDSRSHYATKLLGSGKQLNLGDLLRHLPELEDDIIYAGWGHPFVAYVPSYTVIVATGPPPTVNMRFTVSHAHHDPTKQMILDRESDLLKDYNRDRDMLDALAYSTVGETITTPGWRQDVVGDLHMDFARTSVVLGEPVIYFAALFILSSVVRYDPEQWKRLTDDHPAEAILTERFLDVAIRKLPNLILNELHQQAFLFRSSR